jgi:hypothetical protein
MAVAFGTLAKQRGHVIQRRHPCPHLSLHRYFNYQTTKKASLVASTGKLPEPAPTILFKFS